MGRPSPPMKAKEVARVVGLLPQSSIAPQRDHRRRSGGPRALPHQGFIRQWSAGDESAVEVAMTATSISDLRERHVDELSGGQRQRGWAAMVLAEQTPILLLDEPTTFLDIAHQIYLLNLFAELHEAGNTLIAVLHDLNHAARYATHLIAMKEGRIVAQGPPAEIVTAELIQRVFGLDCLVIDDPATGTPLVVPRARGRPAG